VKSYQSVRLAYGKFAQVNFICITHNLLRLFEDAIEKEDIENEQDKERRHVRIEKAFEKSKIKESEVSIMNKTAQRVTQRSIIMIRWLRQYLLLEGHWSIMLDSLRLSYANFGR
jgi:hypothetical protein